MKVLAVLFVSIALIGVLPGSFGKKKEDKTDYCEIKNYTTNGLAIDVEYHSRHRIKTKTFYVNDTSTFNNDIKFLKKMMTTEDWCDVDCSFFNSDTIDTEIKYKCQSQIKIIIKVVASIVLALLGICMFFLMAGSGSGGACMAGFYAGQIASSNGYRAF